jgi:hypothetical protein
MVLAPAVSPVGRSFNGRTRGSGPRYRGSNPCLPVKFPAIATTYVPRVSFDNPCLSATCLVLATPGTRFNPSASPNCLQHAGVLSPESVGPRRHDLVARRQDDAAVGCPVRSGSSGFRERTRCFTTSICERSYRIHAGWPRALKCLCFAVQSICDAEKLCIVRKARALALRKVAARQQAPNGPSSLIQRPDVIRGDRQLV